MMNVKKLKRKCGVRGCGNTSAFSISLTREHGNTVVMCKNCIAAALETANGYVEEPIKEKHYDDSPPLFFEKPIAKEKKAVDETEERTAEVLTDKAVEAVAAPMEKAAKKPQTRKAKS